MAKGKKSKPKAPRRLKILGAMTGTSCDGIDVSCMEFKGTSFKFLWGEHAAYPKDLRKRVLRTQMPKHQTTLQEIAELDRDLGLFYARTFSKMIRGKNVDVIANHGQTVLHTPASRGKGVSIQLGDPTRIAFETEKTVVSHFRQGDISAGGEGAPLATTFHAFLACSINQSNIAYHNLGGISNLTYVPRKGAILSFDTGPANLWIDACAERLGYSYDRGGKWARSGRVDEKALKALMKDPYYRKSPPKSTGRDDFPFSKFKKIAKSRNLKGRDALATATELTARTIVEAYERFVLKKGQTLNAIYFCGGGAKNTFLKERIGDLLQRPVHTVEKLGVDPQKMESQAFAYLGYLSLKGSPTGGPWTGSEKGAPGGLITPGRNWHSIH